MKQAPNNEMRSLSAAVVQRVGDRFFQVWFRALGSPCQLFFEGEGLPEAEAFVRVAAGWLGRFEQHCSRYLPDSRLTALNANAGRWQETDPLIEVMLDLCGHSHFQTDGAFDATSLPLSELWDWKRTRSALPTEDEILAALANVGWRRVMREKGRLFLPAGMRLDFGGVGKEFAVDALRQLGVNHGLRRLLVDLGGDVAVHGDSPEGGGWYVGLEHPERPGTAYLGIRVPSGMAVATSGDYRRYFEFKGDRYGHLLDCRTGCPIAHGTRSVSVVARRCVEAGIQSTAAMIRGGNEGLEGMERVSDVQGCLWHAGEILRTRGFGRYVEGVMALETEVVH